MHRLSVAKTEDTPKSEFTTTPPPRLQKKRDRRKLSAETVYRDVDTLQPLTAADARYEQDQTPTKSEEAEWEEDSQASTLTAQEWATQQGFIFPQPATPPPPIKHNLNQQIRQAMIRRAQARSQREKPRETHYQRFDEGAFGRRILGAPPYNPRRRSLLSVEFKGDDSETSDCDEHDLSHSKILTAVQTKT